MTTVYASKVRMVIRATLVCVTAFGFKLSGEQVASIQLLAEAVMGLVIRDAA